MTIKSKQLLKAMLFILYGFFFSAVSANICVNESGSRDYYFLDIDRLDLSNNLDDFSGLIYAEKEDPDAVWRVFPIEGAITYYGTVASVVAAELYKRIDKDAKVPDVRYVVGESMDGGSGYQLLAWAYKKSFSNKNIMELMTAGIFDDFTSGLYQDHNIERSKAIWNYLGLKESLDHYTTELSGDYKLIRYDYHNSFRYGSALRYYEKCFCGKFYLISDYNCDVDYIKEFERKLQSKHNEMFAKIISEIEGYAEGYLTDADLDGMSHNFYFIKTKAGF